MTTRKLNCWEATKCERHEGGARSQEHGVCPASTHDAYAGVHGGEKAGRACWAVVGSFCSGKVQGSFPQKFSNCQNCDFFQQVKREEESSPIGFATTPAGMRIWLRTRGRMNNE